MNATSVTTQPRVSVAICCYQHGPFIAQAVESVLAQQSTGPIEIVVADDASTDESRAVLTRLAAEHTSLRLMLRDKNVGAAANFVDLYATCRGEYVALLDGDDYWTAPDKLARQIAALDAHPDWSACFHRVDHVDENGTPRGVQFPADVAAPLNFAELLRGNVIQTCSLVLRRSVLPQLPEVFLSFQVGDWPLCMLLAERGELGFLPEVMAAYRVHSGGTWTRRTVADREHHILQMLLAMQDLVRPEHMPLVRDRIQFMFDHYCQHAAALEHSLSWRLTAPFRAVYDLLGMSRVRS